MISCQILGFSGIFKILLFFFSRSNQNTYKHFLGCQPPRKFNNPQGNDNLLDGLE
jgi:hypothetical protein